MRRWVTPSRTQLNSTFLLLDDARLNYPFDRAHLDESGRQCEYFTMMREPIDRLLSAFFYCESSVKARDFRIFAADGSELGRVWVKG